MNDYTNLSIATSPEEALLLANREVNQHPTWTRQDRFYFENQVMNQLWTRSRPVTPESCREQAEMFMTMADVEAYNASPEGLAAAFEELHGI